MQMRYLTCTSTASENMGIILEFAITFIPNIFTAAQTELLISAFVVIISQSEKKCKLDT